MSRRAAVREQYLALIDAIEDQAKSSSSTAHDDDTPGPLLRTRPKIARIIAKERPGELGASDPDVVRAAIASRVLRYRTIDLREDVASELESCSIKLSGLATGTDDAYFWSSITRLLLLLAQAPTSDTSDYARDLHTSGRIYKYGQSSTAERMLFERELWARILKEEGQQNSTNGDDDEAEDDSDTWSEVSKEESSTTDADEQHGDAAFIQEVRKRATARQELLDRIEARKHELENASASSLQEHREKQADRVLKLKTFGHRPDADCTEREFIREALLHLDGMPCRLLSHEGDGTRILKYNCPLGTVRMAHYEDATIVGILQTLARQATTSQQLRSYATKSLGQQAEASSSQELSLRAVAEVVQTELAKSSAQRAQWDVDAIPPDGNDAPGAGDGKLISISSFLARVERQLAPLETVHNALRCAGLFHEAPSPTVYSLLSSLQEALRFERALQGQAENSALDILAQCLLATFAPLWHEMRDWVICGGNPLTRSGGQTSQTSKDTFFVKRRLDIDLREASFWRHGIHKQALGDFPKWTDSIIDDVVTASKYIAVLRAMGLADEVEQYDWAIFPEAQVAKAPSVSLSRQERVSQALFGTKRTVEIRCHGQAKQTDDAEKATSLPFMAQDKARDLSTRLERKLTMALTRSILSTSHNLLAHVDAIHGICLWLRGDAFASWAEDAFAKNVDTTVPDLGPYLQDSAPNCCIDASLIRTSIAKDSDSLRIRCTYVTPWPLNYILTPAVLSTYGDIFLVLFDLERAAHALKTFGLRRPSVLHASAATDLRALLSADISSGNVPYSSGHAANSQVLSTLHGDTLQGRRLFAARRRCICLIDLLRAHMRRDTIPALAAEMQGGVRTLIGIDALAAAQETSVRRLATLLLVSSSDLEVQDRTLTQAVSSAAEAVQKLVQLICDAHNAIESCFPGDRQDKSLERKLSTRKGYPSGRAGGDRYDWEQQPKKRRPKESSEDDDEVGIDEEQSTTLDRDSFVDAHDVSQSNTSIHHRDMPTPTTDFDRWLRNLERGISSCHRTLRQDVGTCLRSATRFGDDDMRDRFAILFDGLGLVAGL